MSALQEVERENLAAEWPDKPAIYNIPPQSDTARYYASNLMRLLRKFKKPDPDDMQWLNLYNRHKAKSRNREEVEEYIEENTKEDLTAIFMSKMESMQKDFDKRVENLHNHYLKIIAEKDKRLDDIIAKQSEQKGKDFAEMVRIVANAGKDGAENANKHLTQALTTTNSLNSTLMNSLSNQYKHTDELDKKRREEVLRLIAEKEKDEPGWFDAILEHIILPNKDNIGNAINKMAGPLLTDMSK